MPVVGYNHQNEYEDYVGIQTSEDRTIATIYIGQGCMATTIELKLDELRAFSEQVNKTLNEMEAK